MGIRDDSDAGDVYSGAVYGRVAGASEGVKWVWTPVAMAGIETAAPVAVGRGVAKWLGGGDSTGEGAGCVGLYGWHLYFHSRK